MPIDEKQITCLTDAINIVKWESGLLADLNAHISEYEKTFPWGTWFRGQERSSWPLVPSIFRRGEEMNLLYAANEQQMVATFKLRFATHRSDPMTTLDWLCLMQQHNCPTRLLDWSENILIALFFAVRDNKETNEEPGALFVLNTFKLNNMPVGGPNILCANDFPCWLRAQLSENTSFRAITHQIVNERPADLKQFQEWSESSESRARWGKYLSRPVAVWPRNVHERMLRQQSVLVVHGGTFANSDPDMPKPQSLEELNDSQSNALRFLQKFQIPPKSKTAIRQDLRAIGIHIASLFPEMEYQSQQIRESWTAKISPESK
jgi:hypothetical protein